MDRDCVDEQKAQRFMKDVLGYVETAGERYTLKVGFVGEISRHDKCVWSMKQYDGFRASSREVTCIYKPPPGWTVPARFWDPPAHYAGALGPPS